MIATEPVNIRELLQETSAFGPEEISRLEGALVGQFSEVRQSLGELESRLDRDGAAKRDVLAAGVASYLLGRHEAADRYLSQLRGNGLAELYHAHALIALERFEEAAAMYERAAGHGVDEVHCTLCRAGALRRIGRLDEAEKLLRSTGREGATRAEYSYQMGGILADRGDTFGAIEYFERAVDMDPHHSAALFRLAGENNLLGNDAEAIKLYEKSLSRPPFFLGALINLGLLYEDTENYAAAAYCFRRVLAAYPNHPRALLYLKDIEASDEMYYDEEAVRHQQELSHLLRTPIADFELSARSRNCLERAGLFTLGDLTQSTQEDLLASKNFGETSLREISEVLESQGLHIGQHAPQQQRPPVAPAYPGEEVSPEERVLLQSSVGELNLSARARKCLTRLGIQTLGELVSKSADELLSVRNFGVTSLNEIRAKLAEKDLRLRND